MINRVLATHILGNYEYRDCEVKRFAPTKALTRDEAVKREEEAVKEKVRRT